MIRLLRQRFLIATSALAVLSFVFAMPALGQLSDKPILSASLGLIRNLQTDKAQTQYALYPEVQLSGPIVQDKSERFELDWSVYGGGWSEEILLPEIEMSCLGGGIPNVSNCSRATHSSLLIGTRLHLLLPKSADWLSFFGGYSRQYVWREWLRTGFDAEDSGNRTIKFNALEVGGRLQFGVSPNILAGVGVHVYFTTSTAGIEVNERPVYTFSVSHLVR